MFLRRWLCAVLGHRYRYIGHHAHCRRCHIVRIVPSYLRRQAQ